MLNELLQSYKQGAILLLHKKITGGWVHQNAYNGSFSLHKKAIFGMILLIMWVDGFKNSKKYAYIIKVWPPIKVGDLKKNSAGWPTMHRKRAAWDRYLNDGFILKV